MAEPFDSGFKFHTARSHRSKISAFHQKIDGPLVGEHPSASVLMKGIFNERLLHPCYTFIWDIDVVLRIIKTN